MKKVNELKAGVILSYINLVISCIIPLIYTPIMLRILGQAEYGVYSLSNSIISYLSLLNFGMGTAVVRYVTMYRAQNDKEKENIVVGLFLAIYSVLAILVCLVGFILLLISEEFFASGLTQTEIVRLKQLIIIMTINTAVSFPSSVFSSVTIAYEKYIFRRILDMSGTILTPIFNLIVLFLGCKSIGLALVGLGMQILYAPINIYYCCKKLNVHPRFKKVSSDFLKEIWGFSAFVFMSSIVDLLYWSTDKVLIGAVIGSVAVAIYNVGGVFTSMLQNMSSAISSVFTPRVTTMVVKDSSKNDITNLLIKVGRIQYLVVSYILSGYIVFGRIFIEFWAGSSYKDAYFVALFTMIPLAIPLIQNIAFTTIVAQNKHQFRSIIYAIIAIINVVSTYLVLPKFGILGASACTGIAFILGNGITMNIYYYKVTGLDIVAFWKNIVRMTIVPAIMVIISGIVVNIVISQITVILFLLEVVIYSIIFVICSWKFTMNIYERQLFIDLLNKAKGIIVRK